MSNGASLTACGCCEPMPPLTAIANRPGLPALAYRIGTYGVFFQRMLDEIHTATAQGASGPARPLAALTTRSPDDPVIALLDAWAVVADVLTFYQERIANEGFLRTALERRSILELARAIGYELSPGVAASAYLQFTVEALIGTAANTGATRAAGAAGSGSSAFNSGIVSVPEGTQVQSVPAPGQLPQSFETSADLIARVDWNALTPRQTRPQDLALYGNSLYLLGATTSFAPGQYVLLPVSQVYLLNPATQLGASATFVPAVQVSQVFLQGTKTGLKSGDQLLLVGTGASGTQTQVFIVRTVTTDANLGTTTVDFDDNLTLPTFAPATFTLADLKLQGIPFSQASVNAYILSRTITEGDLQAFLKMNGWNAVELATLVNNPPPAPLTGANGLFAFGAKAAFFGNNAPSWKSLPKPSTALRGDPYPLDWDTANDGGGRYVWTDSQGNDYTDADVYLDRAYPQILDNTWALLESPDIPAGTPLQIVNVVERSLADYGLSGRATGLSLQLPVTARGQNPGSPSAVAWSADRLDAFAIGLDGNLYHRWWDGTSWGGPELLGGGNLVNSPSAVSWAANRIDVFAVGSDGCLYHKAWDGTVWAPGGLENLGAANLINSPSAVAWAANRLDIFAIGADGNLYHKYWNGSSWGPSGLENLGDGTFVNSPSAVSWAANRLDIFAVSATGDLLHKWWDGNNWGGPEDRGGGGNLINSPSAVSWAANRLDAFAVGLDGNLYHQYFDGTNWGSSTLENLGNGTLVNSPSAVSRAANRLDIFAVSSAGDLMHEWWDNGWGGLEDLGGDGNLINSPSAVSWASARLDIFATGASGHWLHKWWGGTWGGPEDLGDGSLAPFPVRTTTAFVQSQALPLAGVPVVDDIPRGTADLMLGEMVLGLTPGQAIALSGVRTDPTGVVANEILVLSQITHVGGFTSLSFVKGLQYGYQRASVTLSANVTLGTHGATVREVLGSGDGTRANQTFVLKRPPLTYVSASTPSGLANTLEIRVNGVLWQEAPTLYGLTTTDREYVVRLADDGTPSVTFGDPAVRLRSGQQNVSAVYRTGIGLAGNVAAGSLAMLQSRQAGLRGVTNPLPATGGADPQQLADARADAPLTVLTLDRIVSLDDYQSFAQAFPGVGKAQAIAVWSGTQRLVHITIGSADGQPIDASWPLYQTLFQAIEQAHDPVQIFAVAGFQLVPFNLKAALLIDQPTYDPTMVMAAVSAALAGAFSFANRAFAQAVTAAEIITLIQAVPGVIAVYLTQLYQTSDPTGAAKTEPSPFLTALPARWEGGTILPAQLLLLNPLGVNLTEVAS
jgi:hypothetical protein